MAQVILGSFSWILQASLTCYWGPVRRDLPADPSAVGKARGGPSASEPTIRPPSLASSHSVREKHALHLKAGWGGDGRGIARLLAETEQDESNHNIGGYSPMV